MSNLIMTLTVVTSGAKVIWREKNLTPINKCIWGMGVCGESSGR